MGGHENGKTKPPLALVRSLKVLDRHPGLRNEVRAALTLRKVVAPAWRTAMKRRARALAKAVKIACATIF